MHVTDCQKFSHVRIELDVMSQILTAEHECCLSAEENGGLSSGGDGKRGGKDPWLPEALLPRRS